MSEELPNLDETIAVAAADETVAIPAVTTGDSTVVVGDETIVVNLVEASDETVVVNLVDTSDETVVVNVSDIGDETVVVPGVVSDEDGALGDATVVVAGFSASAGSNAELVDAAEEHSAGAGSSVSRRSRRHRAAQSGSLSASPAPPVDGPVSNRGISALFGGGAGLDPKRPIAPAPGTTPWDAPVSGKRGVAQGIPVSYGARAHTEAGAIAGIDEVQRKLGAAPQGHPVVVREGREQLPSLRRLDQRRRIVTLAIYGGVTVVCIVGLWGVATIAFGW